MNLVIRTAVAADEAAIAGLHAESWRGSYRGVLPDTYLDGPLADEMREKWRRRLASPPPGWLVLISTLDDAFGGFLAGPRSQRKACPNSDQRTHRPRRQKNLRWRFDVADGK